MIKIVIADDSALLRKALTDVLERSGKVKVVAAAKNGQEAIDLVKTHKPDILILDCEMPVMNGLEALRRVMIENPLPVFMFSSLTREGAAVTIRALEYGAVDFLLKPTGGIGALEAVGNELVRKLSAMAMRSLFAKAKVAAKPKTGLKPAGEAGFRQRQIDLIALGASTGGVNAICQVITKLPVTSKPIVIVQHMPPKFTKSFAERLDSLSNVAVKEAEDNDTIENGKCYIAPGGIHTRVVKVGGALKLRVQGEDKVSGHCPSCDVLFDSVSQIFGSNVLGVILTGMGEDGTEGLVKMHKKGAYVIGQDEDSCVVYGMPKAAVGAGAVDIELPLDNIAGGIMKVCGG